jgi:hypothetical protein
MRILNPLKDAKKYTYYLMLITFCRNFFVQFPSDLKSAQTSVLFLDVRILNFVETTFS